jgi:hypothetical protein
MVWPNLSRRHRSALVRYLDLVQRVYEGVRAVSEARVIVDATKVPWHGFMLWNGGHVDLRVAHLVRDSRGVAFSNVKLVPRQSSVDGKTQRGGYPPIRTATRWIWVNLAYEVLTLAGAPVAIFRYEDLVRDPRGELTRVAAHAGVATSRAELAFIRDGEAELPVAHLVAGNRLRSATGPIRIVADEEWRTGLRRSQRRLVSAMTWPLMLRYRQRTVHARSLTATGPDVPAS